MNEIKREYAYKALNLLTAQLTNENYLLLYADTHSHVFNLGPIVDELKNKTNVRDIFHLLDAIKSNILAVIRQRVLSEDKEYCELIKQIY